MITKKDNILKMLLLWSFIFILIKSIPTKKQLKCLTGHKLLVREKVISNLTDIKYKLSFKCVCPNNYYGDQCQTHLGMNCYLNPLNSLNEINQNNIANQMNYDLQFNVDCWVRDKMSFLLQKIQLRQFLSKYNSTNAYGIRQQFGDYSEIIWANKSQLFDQKGLLKQEKYNNTPPLTTQQKLKIFIGNNTQLYGSPFIYKQNFLGYGLINGNITFNVNIINPQKGSFNLRNYSQSNVTIMSVQEYINSYRDFGVSKDQRNSLIKNITEFLKNGTINETIQKYINGTQKPKNIDFNRSQINQKLQRENKILPNIKIPIKLNPYNSTFYQSIRLQVQISEIFQQIVTHQVSINSASWIIPVKIDNFGLPQAIKKNLTVTDSSYKSYYKVLLAVLVMISIYFGLTYGYKRYKKYKNKQYTQFVDEQINYTRKQQLSNNNKSEHKRLHQQSVRSSTTNSASIYQKGIKN